MIELFVIFKLLSYMEIFIDLGVDVFVIGE